VSADTVIGLVLSVLIAGFLVAALVVPEKM
jgi:K+-transporting ATPase KdpF subunit